MTIYTHRDEDVLGAFIYAPHRITEMSHFGARHLWASTTGPSFPPSKALRSLNPGCAAQTSAGGFVDLLVNDVRQARSAYLSIRTADAELDRYSTVEGSGCIAHLGWSAIESVAAALAARPMVEELAKTEVPTAAAEALRRMTARKAECEWTSNAPHHSDPHSPSCPRPRPLGAYPTVQRDISSVPSF